MADRKEVMADTHFNPRTLRLEYSATSINGMTIKDVTPRELAELMCELDYNPSHLYPEGVKVVANERGHDSKYRYRLNQ